MWRSPLGHESSRREAKNERHIIFFVKHGVDIYKVKKPLGHSGINYAMRYAHMSTEFIQENAKEL